MYSVYNNNNINSNNNNNNLRDTWNNPPLPKKDPPLVINFQLNTHGLSWQTCPTGPEISCMPKRCVSKLVSAR